MTRFPYLLFNIAIAGSFLKKIIQFFYILLWKKLLLERCKEDSSPGFYAKLQNRSTVFESQVAYLAESKIVTGQAYSGENPAL